VVVKTTLNLIDYPAYSSAEDLYTALSNDLTTAAGNGQFTTSFRPMSRTTAPLTAYSPPLSHRHVHRAHRGDASRDLQQWQR
jgi:hypothetical protein